MVYEFCSPYYHVDIPNLVEVNFPETLDYVENTTITSKQIIVIHEFVDVSHFFTDLFHHEEEEEEE